jgi:rsbT co-antagonist protein RsbR
MCVMADGTISSVLKKSSKELQASWAKDLAAALPSAKGRISANELEQQAAEFLALLAAATERTTGGDITAAEYKPLREFLEGVSRSRAHQGFTSDETATFIFSFKRPLFEQLRLAAGKDTETLADLTLAGERAARLTGPAHHQDVPESARGSDQSPAARNARAVDAGREVVGRHPRAAHDRHAGLRTYAGGHGEPAPEGGRHRRQIAILDITGVPTVDTLVRSTCSRP